MDNDGRKHKKSRHTLFWIIFIELAIVCIALAVTLLMKLDHTPDPLLEKDMTFDIIEETERHKVNYVPKPDIDEQILTINDYSRPGDKIKSLDYIVIHYLANPKTTAQENHDYFESLKDLKNVSMSANYVVGIKGEIIHCVPDDEVAYASNDMNDYSISIENCHLDTTGRFTKATYNSLVCLTAYLSEEYDVDRDHIIRHYDVTGKDCPKYFVEHEDAWERFKDEVMAYRKECMAEGIEAHRDRTPIEEGLAEFLEENARETQAE